MAFITQTSTYTYTQTHTERDVKADWQLRDKQAVRTEDAQRRTEIYSYASYSEKHAEAVKVKVKGDKNTLWKWQREIIISLTSKITFQNVN